MTGCNPAAGQTIYASLFGFLGVMGAMVFTGNSLAHIVH